MANDEAGNRVMLNIHVPKGRVKAMRRLLRPLLQHTDPSLLLVRVQHEDSPLLCSALAPSAHVPGYRVGLEDLSTPSVCLVTCFPHQEDAQDARDKLFKFPWKFHHRIEVQDGPSSDNSFATKQEFYSLSRQYPLCSVGSSPPDGASRVVRFQLFVRRYRAMLEFYRLLVDSEMESDEPGFALFEMNASHKGSFFSSSSLATTTASLFNRTSAGCSVQLALKQCPYLDPYPLTCAYLTFFVRSTEALRTVLPGKALRLSPHSLLVQDPDGNYVIVRDLMPRSIRPSHVTPAIYSHVNATMRDRHERSGGPCSKDSGCDSQDSGLFSDSEPGSSENDQHERVTKQTSQQSMVLDTGQGHARVSDSTGASTDPGAGQVCVRASSKRSVAESIGQVHVRSSERSDVSTDLGAGQVCVRASSERSVSQGAGQVHARVNDSTEASTDPGAGQVCVRASSWRNVSESTGQVQARDGDNTGGSTDLQTCQLCVWASCERSVSESTGQVQARVSDSTEASTDLGAGQVCVWAKSGRSVSESTGQVHARVSDSTEASTDLGAGQVCVWARSGRSVSDSPGHVSGISRERHRLDPELANGGMSRGQCVTWESQTDVNKNLGVKVKIGELSHIQHNTLRSITSGGCVL